MSVSNSVYSFHANSLNGEDVHLEKFQNKALLIVNVASQCGFTPQYEGLEALYQKYKDQGFEVLGFPCNQFGKQEPGNADEIKACSMKYDVTFPMFEKIEVNGDGAHPLYKFLKKEEKGLLGTEAIKWNFTKFLVDKKGQVVDRFAPQDKPEDLAKHIEKLL